VRETSFDYESELNANNEIRQRSLYLGMLEIMWAIAGGIGPILGGAFTEKLSWRWCFWINLPISGTTFLLLLLFLDVHNPKTKVLDGVKAIDWCGSLSILALTLMLLIGLEFGGAVLPWNSPTVVCLLVFGSLTILFFVYSEKRLAKYPLMPLNMLEHRSNVACLLLCFFQGMVRKQIPILACHTSNSLSQVFIAAEYYLPLYFQSALSASPLRSGLLVLPITVSEALTGIVAGVIMHRTGRYVEIIYIGTILMTIGNGLYILLTPDSSVAFIIGFQILAGVGAGFLFSPPLIALQALVSQDDTATATATFGFVRSLATSVSIVVGGTVFQNQMEARIPFLKSLGLSTTVTDALSSGGAAANVLVIGTIEDEAQQYAVKDAFARSLQSMWILYTCVAACSVIASIFIKRSYLSKEHVETKTGLKKEDTSISPVVSLGQAGLVVV
jgi:MFS family permease